MIEFFTNTPHPVYSKDYTEPKGGAHDNTSNSDFVVLMDKYFGRKINFLDLGCAGGGLVKDMVANGHNGFGIDGSDAQKKEGKNGWGEIPDRLFNADITEPFHFKLNGQPLKFDVISAWDVMEHLYEDRLSSFCNNIKNNLSPEGYFVCGIADFEDEGYHVTLHDKDWWVKMFEDNGLKVIGIDDFDDIVRRSSFHIKVKIK